VHRDKGENEGPLQNGKPIQVGEKRSPSDV